MITLHYPTSLTQSYVIIRETLFPLPVDNTVAMQVITDEDFISEVRGIYGENEVTHLHSDGDLTYDPVTLKRVLKLPTPPYPSRVVLDMSGFGYVAERGLYQDSQVTTNLVPTSPTIRYKQCIWGSVSDFRCVKVAFYTPTPTRTEGSTSRFRYTELSRTATTITYEWKQQFWGPRNTPTNWENASKSDFDAYFPSSGVYSNSGISTFDIRTPPTLLSSSVLTPEEAKFQLLSLIGPPRSLLFKKIHEGKPYGTLAAEAVESMDLVHTNMISFFSELRDPTSLIPKLKALSRLKTLKGVKDLSDYYLSGKYGVLPTISDLKEIVGAFNRVKPYIDKNGFKTYNAGYTDVMAIDESNTSTLTQRMKVALSNEERGLLSLLDGIEAVGLMPNLSNIWDLVPYSFALDWFIGVGDYLESVDSTMRIATLNIKYTTMSRKRSLLTVYNSTPVSPFQGSVEWVYYHRWVSVLCPLPPLSLQVTGTVSSHWLEASALLIQRAKF